MDFSENMLAVAAKRQEQAGLANIRLQAGNAMALPYADAFFDCAVISFGLRNVPDYAQVLREMYRVLRPGGTLFCLDSSYPTSFLIKPFF